MQGFHALYHADCMRLFGGVFGHDDAVNDRTVGGKLDRSWLKTQVRPFSCRESECYLANSRQSGFCPKFLLC